MMMLVVIGVVSFLTAILTFFSGFGMGTLLMPVLAIFFPIEVAIALTGVVHFTNNIFKLILVGKQADKGVLLRFGVAAILSAFVGAFVLLKVSDISLMYHYEMFGRVFKITPIKLVIAIILFCFAVMEVAVPKLEFGRDKLILGGILSGFLGGLSGIQGALRSAFLIKSGLSKEAYIATGVVIACLVDISRLSVYSSRFFDVQLWESMDVLLVATISALVGAFMGKKLLKKVTLKSVQRLVFVMLIGISVALGVGLI